MQTHLSLLLKYRIGRYHFGPVHSIKFGIFIAPTHCWIKHFHIAAKVITFRYFHHNRCTRHTFCSTCINELSHVQFACNERTDVSSHGVAHQNWPFKFFQLVKCPYIFCMLEDVSLIISFKLLLTKQPTSIKQSKITMSERFRKYCMIKVA